MWLRKLIHSVASKWVKACPSSTHSNANFISFPDTMTPISEREMKSDSDSIRCYQSHVCCCHQALQWCHQAYIFLSTRPRERDFNSCKSVFIAAGVKYQTRAFFPLIIALSGNRQKKTFVYISLSAKNARTNFLACGPTRHTFLTFQNSLRKQLFHKQNVRSCACLHRRHNITNDEGSERAEFY